MYKSGSTRSENDIRTTGPFDYIENYNETASIVLGGIQVVFGLLSIALGIGSLCTLASAHSIAYGIWCGILFCVSGILCVFAGYKKTVCMILPACISSIISILLAVVQIALGIVAAVDDSPSNRHDMIFKKYEPGYLNYDIYYKRNTYPLYICSNPDNPFNWTGAWAPVDILLILSGFAIFICAMATAFMSCIAVNKGPRLIRQSFDNLNKSQEVFGNEIYYTDRKK